MVTLFDVVERISLESKEIDSLFRGKSRHMMNFYAKEGVGKLGLAFAMNIHGWTVQIPASCKVQKPEGYHSFIRASVVTCDGKLIEIGRNNNIPTETFNFLINCDGSILSDENGALEDCGNGSTCTETDTVCKSCKSDACKCDYVCNPLYSDELNQYLYDIHEYKDSWIRVKNDNDFFTFSSDLEEAVVFIEYYSNQTKGIEECAIKIDDNLSLALEYYIKYRLLEGGQETAQQSEFYKRKFVSEAGLQKSKQNALTLNKLYEVLVK